MTPLEIQMAKALEACKAYIPGSEVRSWPPGHQLKRDAMRLSNEALVEFDRQKKLEEPKAHY